MKNHLAYTVLIFAMAQTQVRTWPVMHQPSFCVARKRLARNAHPLAMAYWAACLSGCLATMPLQPSTVIIDGAHDKGTALAFNGDTRPTHRLLASAGTEGSVRLWRAATGEPVRHWQAHDGPVNGLAFLGPEDRLLTGGYDGVLTEWDTSGTRLRQADTPSPITSLAIGKEVFLTGHTDGHVRVWNIMDFKLLRDLALHRGDARAVAVHAESGFMASSGRDGNVFLWRQLEAPKKLPAPPSDAYALAFSPDGSWLTGSGWFNLFQWRLDSGMLTILRTPHHGIVKSIQYTAQPHVLATISRETDSSVIFLDATSGQTIRQFEPHELCGGAIRVSADGRFLATTSDDQSVRIWDMDTSATTTGLPSAVPVRPGPNSSPRTPARP